MREKILFNDGWLFHRGDIKTETPPVKGPIYIQSKTERMKWGPASKDYISVPNDSNYNHEYKSDRWEEVCLPHDYIVLQETAEQYNNALGFFKYENAWYRKKFTLDPAYRDKRVVIYFEGVATHATVYLNGCLVTRNFCGYTSFEADITDIVKYEGDNWLAVYVNTENHEGWWYEGGGIYRNVWLCVTDRVSVDLWGLYVHPEKKADGLWQTNIDLTLRSDDMTERSVRVECGLYNADGECAGRAECSATVPAYGKSTVSMTADVTSPRIWDIDDTNMYTARVRVFDGEECIDEYSDRYGYREFYIDSEKGFFLNGRHVKINGVCGHGDFGLTGKAVPDNIYRHKVRLIKEMGANGYRCSHYPQAQATMDALDDYGFIVMSETRWFDTSPEGIDQLEMLVRRDRNHPSVFFWSISNEEMYHIREEGRRITRHMMARVKALDNTRPITSAVSVRPDIATVFDDLDIVGINYNPAKFAPIREKYPNKPFLWTECCATGTTRGWYLPDNPQRAYINSYDKDTNGWFQARETTWKFLGERDWVMGGYQWIAFEHRGEATWPRVCSQSGAIDLYMQKKDAFYQNQSMWLDKSRPMVHLMPHWNFRGFEGREMDVRAYSNCDAVELFFDGQSQGMAALNKFDHAEWKLTYRAGEIKAVGYINGKAVCEDSHRTTGAPAALKLILENGDDLCANGQDVALYTCVCVDADGNEVPDATPLVRFSTNALGRIVGTGSDISDRARLDCPDRRMRAGRIGIAVRAGSTEGTLTLYAEAEGLATAIHDTELSSVSKIAEVQKISDDNTTGTVFY